MKLDKKNWLIVLSLLGALTTPVVADDLLDETEEILNSEEIDVQGTYQQRPKKTAADVMAERRRKIEERNEQMVRKRIENIRLKEERELAKKLKGAFSGNAFMTDQTDTVSEKKAAPVEQKPAVEKIYIPVPQKPIKKVSTFKEFSLSLNAGGQQIKGTRDDFNTNLSTSIEFDYNFSNRMGLIVGFGMSKMEITDTNCVSDYTCGYSNYGSYYNSYFPQGREIDYKNTSIGLGMKVKIGNSQRFKPFVGVIGAYNRLTMEYADNLDRSRAYDYADRFSYYGGEQFSANYISLTGILGAELVFTPSIALKADLRYGRAVSDLMGLSTPDYEYQNFDLRDDQLRLEGLADRIVDADFLSANVGLVVSF